jgi:hypothetical protein
MNYAPLFAFIVRLIGLYFLYSATSRTIMFLTESGVSRSLGMSGWHVTLSIIGQLLAAMWFFKGAPPYSGWAYRELDHKAQ